MKMKTKDPSSLSGRAPSKISRRSALSSNRETWEIAAHSFHGVNAIPSWGPFGVGEDSSSFLIGKIKNQTFLEIACGSGHSIDFLIRRGAQRVYGIDITRAQIESAKELNRDAIQKGKVQLFEFPMEKRLEIPPVDIVFSIYGIGWTVDPKKTLSNIYSYLKPGGRFVWSWDHAFFTDVEFQRGQYVVKYPYHEEREIYIKGWRGGRGVYITYRKTATWFKLLSEAGFRMASYLEPEPRKATRQSKDKGRYYSIYKARMVPSTMIFICERPAA